MNSSISVTLNCDEDSDEQGKPIHALKIQGRDWEMNIWMREAEMALIPDVKTARWSERTSLKIGKCAGVQTYWSCEDEHLSILLGDNDETWDFGITIPAIELDAIISEIQREMPSKQLFNLSEH